MFLRSWKYYFTFASTQSI